MYFKLLLFALVPFLFGMSETFAASEITIDTNQDSFEGGDTAEITGMVKGGSQGELVAIEIKDATGETILIRTVAMDSMGNFDLEFKLPKSIDSGMLEIVASTEVNGEKQSQTKEIEYTGGEVTTPAADGGGCLIATAAFGSELATQVQQLRELRDNTLLETKSGNSFMIGFNKLYYSFSPTVADLERQSPIFKETVKLVITPLLTSLSILNYLDIDSDEKVLGYGIGIILLNIGMYFVAPAVIILKIKKIHCRT